jgi:hypothetical protein
MDMIVTLLKAILKTLYTQHQDMLSLPNIPAWLRHFAHGYELQQTCTLWTEEEWDKIINEDVPNYFRTYPDAANVWSDLLRRFYPCDVQRFIDAMIHASLSENSPP